MYYMCNTHVIHKICITCVLHMYYTCIKCVLNVYYDICRFGLTGTALQNNFIELWSLLNW